MPLSPDLRGALFMTLSMAGFAVEDLFIKLASRHVPVGQVMVTMGLCGMLVFGLMARTRGEAAFPRAFLLPGLLLRSGFEVAGRLFYALAIALAPLSTTSAILQATPLVVIAGASVIFGERVDWRRWAAIMVGFCGVMIIIGPGVIGTGVDGFSALSLLAVAGMLGFAGRDLATRAAPKVLSNRQLGVLGFAMLGLAGLIVLAFSGGAHLPSLPQAGYIGGALVFGVAAYWAVTQAMRLGEVSVITPFRYSRLVAALIIGFTVFGERPDLLTLLGAALIIGSGLYTFARERLRKRALSSNAAAG